MPEVASPGREDVIYARPTEQRQGVAPGTSQARAALPRIRWRVLGLPGDRSAAGSVRRLMPRQPPPLESSHPTRRFVRTLPHPHSIRLATKTVNPARARVRPRVFRSPRDRPLRKAAWHLVRTLRRWRPARPGSPIHRRVDLRRRRQLGARHPGARARPAPPARRRRGACPSRARERLPLPGGAGRIPSRARRAALCRAGRGAQSARARARAEGRTRARGLAMASRAPARAVKGGAHPRPGSSPGSPPTACPLPTAPPCAAPALVRLRPARSSRTPCPRTAFAPP